MSPAGPRPSPRLGVAAGAPPPRDPKGPGLHPSTEAKPAAADEEIDMPSLITGSSGLLGRCLVERLEERGDELRLLDLIPPPAVCRLE